MLIGKNFVFIHIPKCAGTFIREYLSNVKLGRPCRKWHIPASESNIFNKKFIASIRSPFSYYLSLYQYHKAKPKRENNRFYNHWSTYQDFEIFINQMMEDKDYKLIDLALGKDPIKPVVKWMNEFDVGFFTIVYLYMCFDHDVFSDIDNYNEYRLVNNFVKLENIYDDMLNEFNLSDKEFYLLKKNNKKNESEKKDFKYSESLKEIIKHKDRIIFKEFGYE